MYHFPKVGVHSHFWSVTELARQMPRDVKGSQELRARASDYNMWVKSDGPKPWHHVEVVWLRKVDRNGAANAVLEGVRRDLNDLRRFDGRERDALAARLWDAVRPTSGSPAGGHPVLVRHVRQLAEIFQFADVARTQGVPAAAAFEVALEARSQPDPQQCARLAAALLKEDARLDPKSAVQRVVRAEAEAALARSAPKDTDFLSQSPTPQASRAGDIGDDAGDGLEGAAKVRGADSPRAPESKAHKG